MNPLILQLDGMCVPVEVGNVNRRARLTMEADGSLRLRAAADVAPEELQEFLASKRSWVYRKLAENELLRHEPIRKELVDGEGFLYLGRNHRLLLSDEATNVYLHRGRLVIPRRSAEAGIGKRQILDWYQERGVAWLRPRVRDWAQRLQVDPTAVVVADLGTKWGAASPDGRVRVHWATLQLSSRLVDYVLVHELSHLREPHHGPAFWGLVARILPEYADDKAELARRGAALWMGGMS